MAAPLEPSQLFQYDVPGQDSPAGSKEMRDNYEGIARTFLTTVDARPAAPREGQRRIFKDPGPPANVKYQWYDGATWRTLLQQIEGGVAAPLKQIVEFNIAQTVWTINHNIGSQPLVQVFDTARRQLQPIHTFPEQNLMVARLSAAALTAVPTGAPFPQRVAIPLPYNGAILSAFVAVDELIGAVGFAVDFAISGVPITGGTVTVAPAVLPGVTIPGAAVTALNLFTPASVLDVLITTAAPIAGGAIDVFLVLQRTLNPGQCFVDHPTDDRVVITHPAALTGRAVILG
jgi:hypothetical protein